MYLHMYTYIYIYPHTHPCLLTLTLPHSRLTCCLCFSPKKSSDMTVRDLGATTVLSILFFFGFLALVKYRVRIGLFLIECRALLKECRAL